MICHHRVGIQPSIQSLDVTRHHALLKRCCHICYGWSHSFSLLIWKDFSTSFPGNLDLKWCASEMVRIVASDPCHSEVFFSQERWLFLSSFLRFPIECLFGELGHFITLLILPRVLITSIFRIYTQKGTFQYISFSAPLLMCYIPCLCPWALLCTIKFTGMRQTMKGWIIFTITYLIPTVSYILKLN